MGFVLLFAASVVIGIQIAPEDKEIPVVLADGSVITPPWYIEVDGEKAALVESEEAAEAVLQEIVKEYQDSDNVILDVEVKEETDTEAMAITHGAEVPDILTIDEAKKKLTDGYLTVVTTEEQVDEETIEFKEEYRSEPEMYVGQTKVQVQGEEGVKEITKKVVKENGEPVDEKIIEEEIIEEPVEQVILTGIKEYTGYGGGEESSDSNVSYNIDATYETLKTPIDDVYISSNYGMRWGRLHRGTDFALATGNTIYAADDGVVYCAGYSGSYGNLVKIDHGNGMQTYYAHCSRILVSDGQDVKQGQPIAEVGSTGNSTGPHLHFEVIINGSCVNPVDFLNL